MTHPTRVVRRNIDTAIHRLHAAERIAPDVIDDIAYRKQIAGTTGGEHGRGGKGSHSDPTARLAAERAGLEDKIQRIAEASVVVLRAIDHFDRMCRDGLGRAVASAEDEQRCGGHPAGTDCGELIGYVITDSKYIKLDDLGLCSRCRVEHDADQRRARDAERKRMDRHDPRRRIA